MESQNDWVNAFINYFLLDLNYKVDIKYNL